VSLLESGERRGTGYVATSRVQVAVSVQTSRDAVAQTCCSFGKPEHDDVDAVTESGPHQVTEVVGSADDNGRLGRYVLSQHRGDQQVSATRIPPKSRDHQIGHRMPE
jgi:hypothetical protein